MISKFGKLRDSWLTKAILTITALSFMSLFGVTGYINTANSNKTVIKVDDIEISQSEFNYFLQREISKLKNLPDAEISDDDELTAKLTEQLAKIKLDDAIIDNTMKKYGIDFTNDLVRHVIFSQPQFTIDGKFDNQQFKWYLSRNGLQEKEFVATVKRSIARKLLLDNQVAFAKVPEVLRHQMQKVMGQRRTFRYIKITGNDVQVTREPSENELDQYYDDMKEDLMVPEKRDVRVMFLSLQTLEDNIKISEDEVAAYHKEHISDFEQPEQRMVLQMVFDRKENAEAAYQKIAAGYDFLIVAEENGQSRKDVDLGYVSRDDLVPQLAEVAFNIPAGTTSEPIQVADSWQLIEVADVKAEQKVDDAEVHRRIIEDLKTEKLYSGSYEVISAIEDALAGGAELAEVAKTYNVSLIPVKEIDEDGNFANAEGELAEALKNKDVIDQIFSYNEGEVTQAVETDSGIMVALIDKIYDAHPQPRETAEAELRKIWFENEKSSILQEMVENIEHDIEAGDDVATVAQRYRLFARNTMPVTRDETIDGLSDSDLRELFAQPKNYPAVIKSGDDYLVAETTNIYDDANSLGVEDKRLLDNALSIEWGREMSDALLKDFASDYKIEVNYHRMGINE